MKRLGLAVSVLVVALVGSLLVRVAVADNRAPLVVVHWSNSHPMRDGLLPEMAEQFNDADHETASGQPIEILPVSCDSSDQIADLDARLKGAALDAGCQGESDEPADDPTIVTPQSDDWLVDLNHRAGQPVIDLAETPSIAETYLGIVTYRAMAECLGWPEEPVGYSDLVELFSNPAGWRAYPDCAWDPAWGTEPLLAFTNPSTSTSGRNVLVSLYAMAAGKAPADLTVADVKDPDVVAAVRGFQQFVDHYMPGTIPLNTKIAQGTGEGHFFLMPEDNLVNLQLGNEKAIAFDGTEQPDPTGRRPRDDVPRGRVGAELQPSRTRGRALGERRRDRRGSYLDRVPARGRAARTLHGGGVPALDRYGPDRGRGAVRGVGTRC